MKKFPFILITLILVSTFLCSCASGNADNVTLDIGDSAIYNAAEIETAMKIVMDYFEEEFNGCTLTELYYDEDKTSIYDWEETYSGEEVIVLYSTFDVDANGGDGSFNPNSTYYNWQWILTRSDKGEWNLRNYGY